MLELEKILKVNIEEEMQSYYIDYSMSVIVSRALPDIRDGLKPVQRRILYAMSDLGFLSNKPHRKSARIVGEVIGKYHPHGDVSVYDAMVRMAQEWSLRYPLIDGQGNFGSIDDDPPAAMRYTEARLLKIAEEMLTDLDKETVDFKPNFDESLQEPTVLPARIPNLLVNGTSGIAVGMATNMAPHNLSEVIDGIIAYVNKKDITIEELMKYIKAPDFPTGGIIYGYEGVKSAFETGRGRIVMRAKADIEIDKHDRYQIIVTEIPYLVNKAELIAKTDELVRDKKIDGIDEIRDESDREGLRIVYELKRGFNANVILNKLFQETALQSAFNVNNIALVDGKPQALNLKDIIINFVEHRHKIILRRTKYELRQAEEKSHILNGLLIALSNIDEVIKIIKTSKTPDDAKDHLIKNFKLTEIQAKAILDMRLQRLTALEQNKIKEENDELLKKIKYYNEVLEKPELQKNIIKEELIEIKNRYGDERKTQIVYQGEEFRIEDTIIDEEVAITISRLGYIKRTSLREYRRQLRGGHGSKGSSIREEDFIQYLFIARTLNYLLLFTEKGRCYWIRVYEIPEGVKNSRGRAIQNILNIDKDDKVKAIINVRDIRNENYVKNNFIILCTKKGIVKKTSLEAYSRPRPSGIIAINIDEGDHLLEARITNGNNEIMLALKSGFAVRFHESKVRAMGRITRGVRGVKLHSENDEVIGMICIKDPSKEDVLVVSEKGFGKRSKVEYYRITNRGAKGVKTIKITPKTGNLIAFKNVADKDDLMIINKSGIVIRLAISEIRVIGRSTQGVRLIKLDNDDSIASVDKVDFEETLENGNNNGNGNPPKEDINPKLNLSEN